jgi:uncharacterized membrane protein
MTDISMGSGKLNVGGVLSQALATLQSKLLFFVFAGLLIGVGNLAASYPDAGGLRLAIGVIVALAVSVLGQIVTIRATAGPLGVNAATEFAPALQAAGPKFVPVLLTALLVSIIVGLGSILLIVPGIILGVMLSASLQACVLEDRAPIEALKRSRELTRGNRWRVLGLSLILLLIVIGGLLLGAIPTAVAGFVPLIGPLVAIIISSAISGLISVFMSIAGTHAFLELRRLNATSAAAPLV